MADKTFNKVTIMNADNSSETRAFSVDADNVVVSTHGLDANPTAGCTMTEKLAELDTQKLHTDNLYDGDFTYDATAAKWMLNSTNVVHASGLASKVASILADPAGNGVSLNVAPKNHASTETTYGPASTSQYGHVIVKSASDLDSFTSGGTTGTTYNAASIELIAQKLKSEISTRASQDTTIDEKITKVQNSVQDKDSWSAYTSAYTNSDNITYFVKTGNDAANS